jgi:hypothetical protein
MIASTRLAVIVTLVAAGAWANARGQAVESFRQDGIVMDVRELFPIAAKDGQNAAKDGQKAAKSKDAVTQKETAARAFVTEKGVYAFLETPENRRFLKDVKSGAAVSVEGRLLSSGSLLHIDGLSASKVAPKVDLAKYADEKGTESTLQGANKCQCGLSVGDLPHSCALGHLHHLEASDGKIYHYLQYGDGKAAFFGQGTHFKNVEVKARVFPGNFLLVEKGKLLP